jgi:phosphoserine phosphatase
MDSSFKSTFGFTGQSEITNYGDSLLNIPIMQYCQHGIVSVFDKLSP